MTDEFFYVILTQMKKLLLLLAWFPINIILIVFCFFLLDKSYPSQVAKNNFPEILLARGSNPLVFPTPSVTLDNKDFRIVVLEKYLQQYKSPLVNYAVDLVNTADRWGIDYTLLPAIALQESGGCKRAPKDSYNCWGYGIYQDKVTKFTSYQEAMDQVARTIKLSYINNGLTNPTLVEDKWAPPSRGQWSSAVNFFISKIKETENNLSDT